MPLVVVAWAGIKEMPRGRGLCPLTYELFPHQNIMNLAYFNRIRTTFVGCWANFLVVPFRN